LLTALLAPLAAISLVACHRGAPPPPIASAQPTYDHTFTAPGAAAAGARPTVRLQVDRTSVTVADRVSIDLAAEAPPNWTAAWPEIDDALGDFTVAARSEPATSATGDRLTTRRLLTLEPFLPGKHTIPSLRFRFDPPPGSSAHALEVATEASDIDVRPLLGEREAAEIGLFRGVVAPDQPRSSLPWLIGGAISFAGVAGLVAWRVRRRRPALETHRTPLETAQSALRGLEAQPLDSASEMDTFYVRLSGLLRVFAASRHGLPPADRTIEQLLSELAFIEEPIRTQLAEMLARFDEVKFAGAGGAPAAQVARADLAGAWSFVDALGDAPSPPAGDLTPAAEPVSPGGPA
jgi:hypothetical protein